MGVKADFCKFDKLQGLGLLRLNSGFLDRALKGKNMEELVKQAGFVTLQEFFSMVSNVDISTAEKLSAFKNWQNNNGSKEGLMKLPTISGDIYEKTKEGQDR